MTNTTTPSSSIEHYLLQIASLSEKYDLVIEQNNELHACNQQLLRQHEAHETELLIMKKTMQINGFKPFESKNSNEVINVDQVKPQATKHYYKSLDGNTPFRKLSNEIAESLQAQRT
jgi:hypothetical protein